MVLYFNIFNHHNTPYKNIAVIVLYIASQTQITAQSKYVLLHIPTII